MPILFILFVVIPIIEISILIHVGDIIGGWNTVALVILSAFIGAHLVRREGLLTIQKAQAKMQQNTLPTGEMATGVLLLIAGVLLITPGFMTDLLGLALTLPITRALLGKALLKAFQQRVQKGQVHFHYQGFNGQTKQTDDIVEGEFTEVKTSRDDHLDPPKQ